VKQGYLFVSKGDLETEKQQLIEEGRDISSVEAEFAALLGLDIDNKPELQDRIFDLFDRTIRLPVKQGYPYVEPSDLDGIRMARPAGPGKLKVPSDDRRLFDRVHGAWLGRCAGCLLGKPVEGWRTPKLWGFLKDTGNFPLKNYLRCDVDESVLKKYEVKPEGAFINKVKNMVEDDDTNYTVTGLAVMKKYGVDFKPLDVANFWLENISILHTYTAERIAYRNFIRLIPPPASASFRNPYREWIGAQIRADFFGYAAPGNPGLAAEFAWRDACISHVKNGVYGEMWVAAMLAAAAVMDDVREVMITGLSEIPAKSRLAEALGDVLKWKDEGADSDEASRRIHKRWDEKKGHDWCHTISNAQIVALGLLWGEKNFEKSICSAVQAGFDTDCNGATVGSVVGMMLGARRLPAKWIRPLHDTLETGIQGFSKVRISAIAKEGFALRVK